MKQKIFISYAHQDGEYAEKVWGELANLGVIDSNAVTLDPQKEINAGGDIRKLIRASMDEATKVVVIATENAVNSQWVNYEVGMAEALGKHIIVVGKRGMAQSQLLTQYLQRLGDVQALEVEDD